MPNRLIEVQIHRKNKKVILYSTSDQIIMKLIYGDL